jgi:hypothetical protein
MSVIRSNKSSAHESKVSNLLSEYINDNRMYVVDPRENLI